MKYVKRVGNKKVYKPSYYEDNREEKRSNNYYESTKPINPEYIQKCKYCSAANPAAVQTEYIICKVCGKLIENKTKGRFKWIIKQKIGK